MGIVLNIPPASKQSKARRPFYVSPNTQSIAIAAVPNGSGPPTLQEIQVFPVTTPSPCATISGGGESCTFIVQAPFGTDVFYVATFNVPSPTPSNTPLSSFVSGAIVVASPGAGPTPAPLAFTMNGIVNSVVVTVPSPDPHNTPNTQVFTVEVPTSQPLGITPYDVSGNPILSDTFLAPIPISVAPAGEGLTLAMNATCPGSSASGSTATIACAADLANVTFAYDGSVTPDSNDHIVDTFTITAAQNPTPSPSPAVVVLQGNEQTYTPNEGGAAYLTTYLQALSNNVVAYLLSSNSLTTASYGTVNVSTGALSAPVTLNNTRPTGFYTMSDGSIWVADTLNDDILCYPAGSGTPAYTLSLSPIIPSNISFDGTKIWWTATSAVPQNYAYSAPLTGSCSIGANTQYPLANPYQDSYMLISPFPTGGIAIDGMSDGDFYTVSSAGVVTTLNPGFTPGNGFGGGIAADATGETYAGFNNTTNAYIMSLASITGTPVNLVTLPGVQLGGLAAFGPNGTAADRIAYANNSYQTFDIIENPNGASPIIVPATIGYAQFFPSGYQGQNVAISTAGATLAGFYNEGTTAPAIARPLFTTTWSVPVTQLALDDVLGIYERGDSGPFTVTVVGTPPACSSGILPVTGSDHAFFIGTVYITGSCTIPLLITDKNGRSQNVTVTAPENAG